MTDHITQTVAVFSNEGVNLWRSQLGDAATRPGLFGIYNDALYVYPYAGVQILSLEGKQKRSSEDNKYRGVKSASVCNDGAITST